MTAFVAPAHWRASEPLSAYTTWRIGGTARYIACPTRLAELKEDLTSAREQNLSVQILGSGSNLLFPDSGYDGLLIRLPKIPLEGISRLFPSIEEDRLVMVIPAGASLAATARELSCRGLSGFEWAEGIPGTIGGAIVNNAGAYGGSISSDLNQVLVLEQNRTLNWWSRSDFDFTYRSSLLKNRHPSQAVILAAEFRLAPADPSVLAKKMNEIKMERQAKLPTEPSCGCVFKNPAGEAAWRLIEKAGMASERCGAAEVSNLHHNFILNKGGANAEDVLELIRRIRRAVHAETGHTLELEVQLIGFPEAVTREFVPAN